MNGGARPVALVYKEKMTDGTRTYERINEYSNTSFFLLWVYISARMKPNLVSARF